MADDVDPRKLGRPLSTRDRHRQANDEEDSAKIIASLRGEPQTASMIRRANGIGKDRLERLLDRLQSLSGAHFGHLCLLPCRRTYCDEIPLAQICR